MKFVVSGGFSSLGARLVPLLAQAGHTLLLVCRDGEGPVLSHPGTTVTSFSNWESHAEGFEIFIDLGCSKYPEDGCPSYNTKRHLDWVSTLALKARRLGMSRFVYFSTMDSTPKGRDSLADFFGSASEESARSTLGGFVEIVYLGRVHGEKSAKMSFRGFFSERVTNLFSALRPTTSIHLVVQHLLEARSSRRLPFLILTDKKSQNFGYLVWRALVDGLFVVTVLLLLPALMGVWLVVVLNDGRPGLFSQERVGRERSVFRCFKLRTMRKGTVSMGTHHVSQHAITGVGRTLRRFKIDELPQVWNILRGEMSLIGPRPCLPTQEDVVAARTSRDVFDIRPGLTGWAQVKGVDMREAEKLARYDAEYIGLQSIWIDVLVLKETLLGRQPS